MALLGLLGLSGLCARCRVVALLCLLGLSCLCARCRVVALVGLLGLSGHLGSSACRGSVGFIGLVGWCVVAFVFAGVLWLFVGFIGRAWHFLGLCTLFGMLWATLSEVQVRHFGHDFRAQAFQADRCPEYMFHFFLPAIYLACTSETRQRRLSECPGHQVQLPVAGRRVKAIEENALGINIMGLCQHRFC